jgi:hypothetical protein
MGMGQMDSSKVGCFFAQLLALIMLYVRACENIFIKDYGRNLQNILVRQL